MKIAKKTMMTFLLIALTLIAIFCAMFFYSFKTTYQDVVKLASKQFNVEQSLIFAVIKAESKFNQNAKSIKGAIGLMQIKPETANYMLQKMSKNNFDNYNISLNDDDKKNENRQSVISSKVLTLIANGSVTETELNNPEINIFLGSKYLKYLINKFKNVDVAICAYNAGETNVRLWLNDKNYSKDGETLINVPFAETKNYLKKVKFNQKIYKKMLNN